MLECRGERGQRLNSVLLLKVITVVAVACIIYGFLFSATTSTTHLSPKYEVRKMMVEVRGVGDSVDKLEDGGEGWDKTNGVGCQPPKRILAWTTFWHEQSIAWESIFFRQVSRQCAESRCELVHDHRLLDSADAVIFHPPDMFPSLLLPPTHPPGQPWIFFSLESASTVTTSQGVKLNRLGGVFNWTMTYRRDSDIVIPYGEVLPRPTVSGFNKDYWAGKSVKKLAAWAVSHCKTVSRREWFVKELVKYMPVDVFGSCGTKKCGTHLTYKTVGTFNQTECNQELEKYMFYLAFENSICLDYITEKFYKALTLDVVPVVLGGGPYQDVAPPHSYIDALAFPSPKHLAKYLKRVAGDREAYNGYFAWKQHFTIELGHPFSPFVCGLCAKLHDPDFLALPNTTRSPMERAGMRGAVRGRDGDGSYPDIESWFMRGSGCRRWWLDAKDHHEHSQTNK